MIGTALCYLFPGAIFIARGDSLRGWCYPLVALLCFWLAVFARLFSESVASVSIKFAIVFVTLLYVVYWIDCGLHADAKRTNSRQRVNCSLYIVFHTALLSLLVVNSNTLTGYQIYQIPSGSMSPTLQINDFVLVDKWWYQKSVPMKGDVVIFNHPNKGTIYIKRVAYVAPDLFLTKALVLGEIAVLGDNIHHSEDSRYFGPIDNGLIQGRANIVMFALTPDASVNWSRALLPLASLEQP